MALEKRYNQNIRTEQVQTAMFRNSVHLPGFQLVQTPLYVSLRMFLVASKRKSDFHRNKELRCLLFPMTGRAEVGQTFRKGAFGGLLMFLRTQLLSIFLSTTHPFSFLQQVPLKATQSEVTGFHVLFDQERLFFAFLQ